MKTGTKRLLGGLAVAAGAMGAIGALMMRSNSSRRKGADGAAVWARPGMEVVFRAELMPGREAFLDGILAPPSAAVSFRPVLC